MTVPDVCAPQRSSVHAVEGDHGASALLLQAAIMGRAHELDADALDRLDSVVSQLAGNIARHAVTGHIVLRPVGDIATGCIEVLALDSGPGISDMTRVMRDDGSASGQGGLSGVRRQAELFDVYSQTGRGTAVVAHVGALADGDAASRRSESVMFGSVGIVCVPLHGEEECGDAWAIDVTPGRVAALLVDGLGHGGDAAVAALRAMHVFRGAPANDPELMLAEMHVALRRTRGAALSVSVVAQGRRTVRFCGVGNVDGRIVTADENRHLIPQNGIVGHTMPTVISADARWPGDGRLVMHTDGISSRWRADDYPGLLARHPALLAGVLWRDFARMRDDATVLVLRDALPAT